MDQSRYRDKAYLVSYELTTDIFDSFDIVVDDIVPVRSVYILYTDKGTKILKKINYSMEELKFINNIVNYVFSNGYEYVVPFMKTSNNSFYVERADGLYIMLDLIEGREADFQNPIDVMMVSKALSKLHKSTEGIPYVIENRNHLYKWIPKFKKRAADLLKFKEIAEMHEIKNEFDEIFLKFADKYYKQAQKSITLLERSDYIELCDKVKDTGNICHHDLAYHNMLIDNTNNVYFVDFDYSIQDIRVHDIANLIAKSVKHCNWDIDKTKQIIDSYSSISELKKSELEVLYGFLTFPQDFYEICSQYYMKMKSWDEEDFISRLNRKAEYYNDREVFIKSFEDVIIGI